MRDGVPGGTLSGVMPKAAAPPGGTPTARPTTQTYVEV
jgi:hypothetical protein